MRISEYEKIPTHLSDLLTDETIVKQLNKLEWVATEKIHGANFRFIYQDKRLLFGKRKALLNWGDDFFGFQKVVVEVENSLMKLFERIVNDFRAETVIVYGELFGGLYPHPEVPAEPDVHAIQTGIYYSPDIRFCAYDIAIVDNEISGKMYLSYNKAMEYLPRFDIFHAKPAQTGKLTDLLNMNLRVESTIPGSFHLPRIKCNIIEGVVIKPFFDLPAELSFRPVIKIKNPEFEENRKFHEAGKWSYIPAVTALSQDLDFLLQELYGYITLNRLNSAISKTGHATSESRWQEIEAELLQDALTDFNIDYQSIMTELNNAQHQWITDRIKSEVRRLMQKELSRKF